jgi:hypothetical protein
MLNISNVRSGSALPGLNVTLKDFYDNIVSTEFSEESGQDVIFRVFNPSCRVQGRTSALIERGISIFNDLVLSCPPGISCSYPIPCIIFVLLYGIF